MGFRTEAFHAIWKGESVTVYPKADARYSLSAVHCSVSFDEVLLLCWRRFTREQWFSKQDYPVNNVIQCSTHIDYQQNHSYVARNHLYFPLNFTFVTFSDIFFHVKMRQTESAMYKGRPTVPAPSSSKRYVEEKGF